MSHFLGRLAAIALGIALAIVLAEATLRIADVGSDQFLQPDPELGLAFIPGASGTSQDACYHAEVTINSLGWRGPETSVAKPDGVERVVVLGDSYMAGLQVGDDEVFARRLERRLRDAGRAVEVLNLGVPAFGTDQQLVAFREHGRAFGPDLVLLAFYAQNDLRNNWVVLEGHTIAKPFFDVIDGELVALAKEAPPPAAFRAALRALAPLRLYPVVRDALRYGHVPRYRGASAQNLWHWPERWDDQVEAYRSEQTPEWQAEWLHSWQVTEALLVALRDDVRAAGAELLLVGMSDPVAVMPEPLLAEIADAAIAGAVDREGPSRRLAAIARRHGIELVSLLPEFRRRAGASDEAMSRYYLPCDGHWTAAGHALAAEVVAPRAEAVLARRASPASARELPPEEYELLRQLGYADWNDAAEPDERGVTHIERERMTPGYHLYSNDVDAIHLDDLEGRRVHTWRLVGRRDCQHADLLPGGRLVVVCAGEALVLLEWDGRVVWQLEANVHHDVAPLPGGGFLVPLRTPPRWHLGRLVHFDDIAEVSADGRIVRRWSARDALPALREGLPPSWLDAPPEPRPNPLGLLGGWSDEAFDYFHTNSVEVLPDTPLGRHDARFAAGKLLVSQRNTDTVFVLDWSDSSIDWRWGPGVVQKQHQPSLLANGHLLVFDNGFERGASRVVEVALPGGEIVWQYPSEPTPAFFSKWQGGAQRLANGHTLITDSARGRALEVDASGALVWEFYQPDVVDGRRRALYRFTRVPPELVRPWLGSGSR